MQLYNKDGKTLVDLLTEVYDAKQRKNIYHAPDHTYAGGSPATVRLSYRSDRDSNELGFIQIVRVTDSSGRVYDYRNADKDDPEKKYDLPKWFTEADAKKGIQFGWHVDLTPRKPFSPTAVNPNQRSGLDNSGHKEVFIEDCPGTALSINISPAGRTWEFEDYVVCLNGEKGDEFVGVVLAGVKWGFVEKTVQIESSSFLSTSVDTVPVFTMLPAKALGKRQTPELKAALEKYSAYNKQKTITYLDGRD